FSLQQTPASYGSQNVKLKIPSFGCPAWVVESPTVQPQRGCVRECRCIKELRNPFRVVPRVLPTQGSGWRRNPGLEYAAPSGQIAGKTAVVVEYQPGIQQEPSFLPIALWKWLHEKRAQKTRKRRIVVYRCHHQRLSEILRRALRIDRMRPHPIDPKSLSEHFR
ncbi:MAG: hypothetical protein BECKG1743E_GA0114224_101261, partial [Candidatus Kentron sp. G]